MDILLQLSVRLLFNSLHLFVLQSRILIDFDKSNRQKRPKRRRDDQVRQQKAQEELLYGFLLECYIKSLSVFVSIFDLSFWYSVYRRHFSYLGLD